MLEIGTTGIIPFSYNWRQAGSTLLRVNGLIDGANDFQLWKHGQRFDNLIFQKVYWKEMMVNFKGPKILDLCDPDWVNGDLDIIEIANYVDAITCSSFELTRQVNLFLPKKEVVCVPDRLNFEKFPQPKESHQGKAKEVVWFGYIQNAHETLPPLAKTIKELGIDLTIISNLPYTQEDEVLELNPIYRPYEDHNIYSQLKGFDIVLNPKSSRAFFKYKSNNKSLIAWKLGIPVAETSEDLNRLVFADNRNNEVLCKTILVNEQFDISLSRKQYLDLIMKIRISNGRS